MRPLTEIRRERLRQLIDEVADGNQSQFANDIGRSRAQVGLRLKKLRQGALEELRRGRPKGRKLGVVEGRTVRPVVELVAAPVQGESGEVVRFPRERRER